MMSLNNASIYYPGGLLFFPRLLGSQSSWHMPVVFISRSFCFQSSSPPISLKINFYNHSYNRFVFPHYLSKPLQTFIVLIIERTAVLPHTNSFLYIFFPQVISLRNSEPYDIVNLIRVL